MPYDVGAPPSFLGDLGALAGAIGAYALGGSARSQAREKLSAELEYQKAQEKALASEQVARDITAREQGYDPTTGQLRPEITTERQGMAKLPKDFDSWDVTKRSGWYRRQWAAAGAAGDTTEQQRIESMAQADPLAYERIATGTEKLSLATLDKARATEVGLSFEHKMAEIGATGAQRVQVAQIMAAARRAAGTGRGYSSGAALQRAMDAALTKAMNYGPDMQYKVQQAIYQTQEENHLADPSDYPASSVPAQPQAPPQTVVIGGQPMHITINASGQPQVTPIHLTPKTPPDRGGAPRIGERRGPDRQGNFYKWNGKLWVKVPAGPAPPGGGF